MRQPKVIYSANDNAPLPRLARKASFRTANISAGQKARDLAAVKKRLSVAAWSIPFIACFGGIYALWSAFPLNALFWPSLIIATALFLTTLQAKRYSRLRNISGLMLIAAITVSLAAWLSQNGFTLIGAELALLAAVLALGLGWIFSSEPAILLSSFSGLFYLAGYYPELGLLVGMTDGFSQMGAGLMPGLILGQIAMSYRLKSIVALFVSLAAMYIWVGTLTAGLPASAIAGLGFALAAAQHSWGTARLEAYKFGGDLNRLFGWAIGLTSALFIQSMWLSPDAGQAKPFWPPTSLWWGVVSALIFTLFVTSLMRYKTSHISLSGIFIVCLSVAALSISTVKPDLVHNAFDLIPGLMARPGLGLVISAVICGLGLLCLITGLKRGRIIDIAMGAVTVSVQCVILFPPDRFNADMGVIFIVSLICALCVGGLVAGASPDRPDNTSRYA